MADGRAANAESASNSPGWDDILLRLPGRGAVALRAGAATPVSASLAAAAPPAWGELLLSRDDTTFTHEASAEERTDAATFRLLPPARRSSGAAAERPFNDTVAALLNLTSIRTCQMLGLRTTWAVALPSATTGRKSRGARELRRIPSV